jgi:hypothetical protein
METRCNGFHRPAERQAPTVQSSASVTQVRLALSPCSSPFHALTSQRCCHHRETHLSAQLCLSSLCPSMNYSDLFPALRACAREECLQRFHRLVDRDRRLRAERAAFRSDLHLRGKLRAVQDGPVSVADVLVPDPKGISKLDINRKR